MKIKILSIARDEDFKRILKGRKITNNYVTIFFKKITNEYKTILKISFIVKKKLGNSVIRNKIKRRLRNIIRDSLKNLNYNLEYSYLFIAKKNVFDDEYELIKKNIFRDLKKIK